MTNFFILIRNDELLKKKIKRIIRGKFFARTVEAINEKIAYILKKFLAGLKMNKK